MGPWPPIETLNNSLPHKTPNQINTLPCREMYVIRRIQDETALSFPLAFVRRFDYAELGGLRSENRCDEIDSEGNSWPKDDTGGFASQQETQA